MKVVIIAGYTPSLINFRGDLIKEMVKKGHKVVTIGPERGYEEEITQLGAKFIQLPIQRASVNPFRDAILLYRLHKTIKSENPDVVFNYTIKPVIYGSIAARLSGVMNVFSMITGLGYVFVGRGIKASIIKLISAILYYTGIKCCQKVFFQNPDDMNEFINSKLIDISKCMIVHGSGVNLEKFKPADMPKQPVFLMISRILRDKGVLEYLEASRKVKENYPEARFHLLGPFDVNPNSLKYEDIKPYVDDGSIEYLGETKDVRPYIKNCSVYVLPSYREGTPRTVLEAMAMGRPVITTDAPGCRETVVDGLNGFLVPIKDIDALAEKMTWMIKNSKEVFNMAQESLKLCQQKYDVKKVNETVLSTIKL